MTVNDKSYVPFSISAPLLHLNNPIEGDEFPQFSEISINWTSVFADSVRIQFSDDNGVTWETLAQTSFVNTYKWKTTEIVSKECFIKITSIDENSLISQSGKFGIGVPKATLLSPNGFEKLCIGQDYPITWTSEFVKIFYLEYSIDNGLNWRKVTLIPIDAKLKQYIWTIPDRLSDQTLIRLSTKVTDIIVLDNSDNSFSIIDCPSTVQDIQMNDINIVISPNPISNVLQLRVNSKKYAAENLKIEIYNLKGEIKLTSNYQLESDMSDIQFDVNDLSNGNYFLMIYIGDGFCASQFTIFR